MSLEESGLSVECPDDEAIRSCILRLLSTRANGATICPSEAARALRPNWRDLMDTVRECARRMAKDGIIAITQRGEVIDPQRPFRGPIRLRLSGELQGVELGACDVDILATQSRNLSTVMRCAYRPQSMTFEKGKAWLPKAEMIEQGDLASLADHVIESRSTSWSY